MIKIRIGLIRNKIDIVGEKGVILSRNSFPVDVEPNLFSNPFSKRNLRDSVSRRIFLSAISEMCKNQEKDRN